LVGVFSGQDVLGRSIAGGIMPDQYKDDPRLAKIALPGADGLAVDARNSDIMAEEGKRR
jgi:hypothetical protein